MGQLGPVFVAACATPTVAWAAWSRQMRRAGEEIAIALLFPAGKPASMRPWLWRAVSPEIPSLGANWANKLAFTQSAECGIFPAQLPSCQPRRSMSMSLSCATTRISRRCSAKSPGSHLRSMSAAGYQNKVHQPSLSLAHEKQHQPDSSSQKQLPLTLPAMALW